MEQPKANNENSIESQSTLKVYRALIEELTRLARALRMGYELDVKWLPGENEKLHGEVKGNTICIYDEDEEEALRTLKHEFIDYLISAAIKPYEKLANMLISLFNEEAYAKKEKLVDVLANAI